MLDIVSPGLPPALAVPFGLIERAHRRLTHHVKTMDQAELEYTGPAENINSTAMLVAHLAIVDLEYLHCIMGKPLSPELAAEYGPSPDGDGPLPVVTGKSAAELLARYDRVIELIREYLLTQTEADAVRQVNIPWWPEPATVRYVLWHMAGHSMFHQGQIARLRQSYRESRS